MEARQGRRGTRRYEAAVSLAPFRAVALRARRLPRTASPAPAAGGPRRNVPGAASRELVSAVMLRQVRRSPCEGHRDRGRNAAHCPGRPLQRQRCSASALARTARGRAYGAPLTPEPLPTQRA